MVQLIITPTNTGVNLDGLNKPIHKTEINRIGRNYVISHVIKENLTGLFLQLLEEAFGNVAATDDDYYLILQ